MNAVLKKWVLSCLLKSSMFAVPLKQLRRLFQWLAAIYKKPLSARIFFLIKGVCRVMD